MIRSNQSLLDMVNTLLEVNCYDAGAKTITPIVCQLWELCRNIVEELTAVAKEKGLELKLSLVGEPETTSDRLLIMGDSQEIRRMITNLIGNSLKFTEEGYVEVSLEILPRQPEDPNSIDGWVQLKVRDTGLGMSPEQQSTIFQRYRKGSHRQAGSGLGLHLVQKIVSIHSGTIRADSAVGEGSIYDRSKVAGHSLYADAA